MTPEQFIHAYPEWHIDHNQLVATFEFPRFLAAIAVINAVAVAAEEAKHHPSYTHNYKQITFRLSTHSAGSAITQKDLALAQKISAIVQLSAQKK